MSGDFNIDMLKEHTPNDKYSEGILKFGMTRLLDKPTRRYGALEHLY